MNIKTQYQAYRQPQPSPALQSTVDTSKAKDVKADSSSLKDTQSAVRARHSYADGQVVTSTSDTFLNNAASQASSNAKNPANGSMQSTLIGSRNSQLMEGNSALDYISSANGGAGTAAAFVDAAAMSSQASKVAGGVSGALGAGMAVGDFLRDPSALNAWNIGVSATGFMGPVGTAFNTAYTVTDTLFNKSGLSGAMIDSYFNAQDDEVDQSMGIDSNDGGGTSGNIGTSESNDKDQTTQAEGGGGGGTDETEGSGGTDETSESENDESNNDDDSDNSSTADSAEQSTETQASNSEEDEDPDPDEGCDNPMNDWKTPGDSPRTSENDRAARTKRDQNSEYVNEQGNSDEVVEANLSGDKDGQRAEYADGGSYNQASLNAAEVTGVAARVTSRINTGNL